MDSAGRTDLAAKRWDDLEKLSELACTNSAENATLLCVALVNPGLATRWEAPSANAWEETPDGLAIGEDLTGAQEEVPIETTSKRRHQVTRGLPEETVKIAEEIADIANIWIDSWHQWCWQVSGRTGHDHSWRMDGGLQWKRVPVTDDRSGPVLNVKVSPELGKAARAAVTMHKIATGLVTEPQVESVNSGRRKWVAAAYEMLGSRHETVWALMDDVGAEAFANVFKDLLGYLKFAQGLALVPPANCESAKKDSSLGQENC